ncbi:hypothetical protein K7711_41230 [Nocardia sp. CA2R105]|uniref:DUF7700 domain-containing protein n=1 Tax=Nocardia coffeae TaxID=2873381 RepID=UPI001CA6215D|nr:hypothetical protein [Nocardia coffeae]MBY8862953.1 hypothetical protein [Nocardia coffeae]
MKVGHVFNIAPEPLAPENTTFYNIGPVQVGIELRHITTESLRETYKDDPDASAALEASLAAGDEAQVDDGGLSVHVIEAASGHEYLRFDCFDEDPHYHYVHRTAPGEEPQNRWVRYDSVANGRMLPWVRRCLTTRLSEMLADADATELAAQLDHAVVAAAIDRIPEMRGLDESN